MSLSPFDDGYCPPEPKPVSAPPIPAAEKPAHASKAEAAPKVAKPAQARPTGAPVAPSQPIEQVADGIYFRMPEDIYHAQERFSATGVQKMDVSAGTFWADSWFNPRKAEEANIDPDDEDALKKKKKEAAARIIGRAYHCARLEPDRFPISYARALSRSDFQRESGQAAPVYSGTDIGEALAELGQPKKKGGESVYDQALRLQDAGYDGIIWPIEKERWAEEHHGLIGLSASVYDDIVEDMDRLRRNPLIADKLSNGAAEVSVFWTDEAGIKCKCRFDYLMVDKWTDFKTFANQMSKHLMQCINDAFRFNRYFVQPAFYRDASEMIRAGALEIVGDVTNEEMALINAIQLQARPQECWYVFQEKGGVPNILGKRFPFFYVPDNTKMHNAGATAEQIAVAEAATSTPTGLYTKGLGVIRKAKTMFLQYQEIYAPGEPWGPFNPLSDFEDADFNANWLEEIY